MELPRLRGTLAVYDLHGDRVAGRGPARGDALVRTALRTAAEADRSGNRRLFAAVPLIENERVAGVVRTMRDDAVVDRRTLQAWLTIAGLAAVLLAAATAAAAVLGGHLAAPLERLAVAARRLGDGDFTVRARARRGARGRCGGAALDATAERLDTLLARERAFSADASHQLRTPLAALRIEIEALELRGGPAPELHAALRQVDRLQATIDTLLAVARDVAQADARADLGALLREVESRWRGGLARDGRALDIRLRAADTTAAASPRVVAEILDVLVANARAPRRRCRHGDRARGRPLARRRRVRPRARASPATPPPPSRAVPAGRAGAATATVMGSGSPSPARSPTRRAAT